MDDKMKRQLKIQRGFLEAYLLGVESRRGKLTRKERDELRYAWLAGFISGAREKEEVEKP